MVVYQFDEVLSVVDAVEIEDVFYVLFQDFQGEILIQEMQTVRVVNSVVVKSVPVRYQELEEVVDENVVE